MAERIRDYECAVLFRPDVEPAQLDTEVEAIRSLITGRGGEIARVDRWNKRMLAYAIKEYTEGFYVIYRWYSTPEVLPELAYHMKFADTVLRHQVLDYTEKERKRRKRLGKNATKPVQAA
jgi:small subunit ribosomal protein S6